MIADQGYAPRSARDRVAALVRDGPVVLGSDPPTTPLPATRPSGRFGAWGRRWLPSWAPAWLRRARFDPGRPGALALAVVTAAAAVLAAVGVWLDRPVVEPAPPLAAIPPAARVEVAGAPSSVPAAAPSTAGLVVSVVGKVARPGLVRVPDGARVADVLDAAGGALPGTDLVALNLARKVADGEQVAVGVPQPPDVAAGVGTGGVGGASPAVGGPQPGAPGRVDLNRATLQQLDALPGVGPVTAQRILDWRSQHGRFGRVEQLREIEGIGERRFAQLRELVTV